ncbi:hypothetical protein QBC47DRAFT_385845 [Echria macrotheca]|uniref:Uncharacterized protein n=1 Tax=Echria macrotheca TaxID=438768 RepID=A0AAJ0F887_9PEZI|nr:hypothetical protein QBC47DRAFT_385845 [Echria macrotheca]
MEPEIFSLEVAKKSLDEEGFIRLNDLELGNDISQMQQRGFPFWSEDGLDFCRKHVLADERIRSILKSWFGERCILVHWLRYTANPGHVICFRRGGPEAGRRRLMVHLMARGSQVVYWSRSHLQKLLWLETEYRYYEIPAPTLVNAGLKGEDLEFKDSHLRAIVDARLGLELKQGYAIAFVFATEDALNRLPPMFLPNLPTLKQKVRDEMESPDIGVNFAFGKTASGTSQITKSSSDSRPKTPDRNTPSGASS